ncbi:MAG: protein kinase, partial [Bryobacteraceae bacterium]
MKITRRKFLAATAAAPLLGGVGRLKGRRAYFVPNFHPASCGWLTNFSKERVYCANSYFDHLDRVSADPQYGFVLSEVNNLIAMMNFRPERRDELKRGIKSGQVELVNGFFLESTINLSGGEALVRLGVEGLRWQKAMFGVRPRFAWTIDVCGTHDQMAQISAGLGLEAMVYTRKNPTGSAVHWTVSPDGSRILTISPGHYSELGSLMTATEPLNATLTAEVEKHLESKVAVTPEGAPMLVLLGSGDYALAPARKEFPREFLEDWKKDPDHAHIRFSVMGKYLDEQGSLTEAEALDLLTQSARGLAAAHAAGLVHRDIKPENMLLDKKKTLRIVDFGLVMESSSTTQLTASGACLGTPMYMSPEQADGDKADACTDIYSLG